MMRVIEVCQQRNILRKPNHYFRRKTTHFFKKIRFSLRNMINKYEDDNLLSLYYQIKLRSNGVNGVVYFF